MKAKKVLISGIAGTSFMTLFSYVLSLVKMRDFREPQTLSKLVRRLEPEVKKKYADIACWNVHYAVGILFAAVYGECWERKLLKPGFNNSLVLGGATGLFAIAVWKSVFSLHPDPPRKNFKRYYGQLFTAHVIFGAFAYLGYKYAEKILPADNESERAIEYPVN